MPSIQVEDDRKDRKLFRVDRTAALKAAEDAIKARWQQEEDDSEATLEREKIEMDQQQAEVLSPYFPPTVSVAAPYSSCCRAERVVWSARGGEEKGSGLVVATPSPKP